MILEFVQLGPGKDPVDGVEDVTFEAGGAGHRRDGRVRRFLDDLVEHLLVLGQRSGDEQPSAGLEDTVRLTERKVQVGGVVDGEGAGHQVEGILCKVERLVEIQKDEIDARAAFLVFCACLVEQLFGEIPTDDFCPAFSIIVEQERQLACAAAHVENAHAGLGFKQIVRPLVDISGTVFFVNIDAGEQVPGSFLIVDFH